MATQENDKIELSLEYLIDKFCGNIENGIRFATDMYPSYPDKPIKPKLGDKHSSAEALAYVEKLKEYEDLIKIYDSEVELRKEKIKTINNIIEVYIKDMACIEIIPERYRDKVYRKAYLDGHSNGFYEVYLELCQLVDIFE